MVRTAFYGLVMLWVSLFWLDSGRLGVRATEVTQSHVAEVRSGPTRVVGEQELARAVRSQFIRKIEPILIETCASSGCHGSTSSGPFRLHRLAVEGAGHPGLRRQNLANVLRQLDSADFHGDSFLKYATIVHGSAEHLFKTLNTRQVHLLQSWIRSIRSTERVEQPQVMNQSRSEVARHKNHPSPGVSKTLQRGSSTYSI